MFSKRLKQNKLGFTIIELLIVVSIIGVLSTISVISLNIARIKSRDTDRVADTKQLTTALGLYFNDKGTYPIAESPIILGVTPNLVLCDVGFVASASSCTPGKVYMAKVPANPSPNGTAYSYTASATTPDTYAMTFALEKGFGMLTPGENVATDFGISSTPQFMCGVDTVTYDGGPYPTVLIGTQCWLTKNIRTTKYPNGSSITKGPAANGAAGWTDVNTAYYSCPSDRFGNVEDCTAAGEYDNCGMLYQWKAAMNGSVAPGDQGICPTGWHIPTDSEWYTLENYLKNSGQTCNANRDMAWECFGASNKLADSSSAFYSPSGFNGVFAGYRSSGTYYVRLSYVMFWSSSAFDSNSAWIRDLYSNDNRVRRRNTSKAEALSVRCIKN